MLISLTQMPGKVAHFLRQSGSEIPCTWFSWGGIYIHLFSTVIVLILCSLRDDKYVENSGELLYNYLKPNMIRRMALLKCKDTGS